MEESAPLSIRVLRLGLLALFVFSLFQLGKFKQESDITRFMMNPSHKDELRLSRLFRGTELSRSMIIALKSSSATLQEKIAFSDTFSNALRRSGYFEKVRNSQDIESNKELFYNLYFPHRYQLFSSNPSEDIPALLKPQSLDDACKNLRLQLASSMGSAVKYLAPEDPLLLFLKISRRIQSMLQRIAPPVKDGHFFLDDGVTALILAQTRADPFKSAEQRRVVRAMQRIFQQANAATGGTFSMDYTGIQRFAIDGERLIRRDINRIFTFSTVGVIFLFLLFFSRFKSLFFIFSPVVFGLVCAIGISVFIYSRLHGLTLAFGSSLIGICIDYPVHLLNHFRFSSNSRGMIPRSLFRSLSMSCFTTLIGFGVLAFSTFPGIRQIALFSGIGILAAFLFTVAVLPVFSGYFPGETPGATRPVRFISNSVSWIAAKRRPILILVLVFVAGGVACIPGLRMKTDIRTLNSTDPETVKTDTWIRDRMPASHFPLVMISTGSTPEQALQNNEKLFRSLALLKQQHRIQDFFSIHPLLFSEKLQSENWNYFVRNDAGYRESMRAALVRNGFDVAMFHLKPLSETAQLQPLTCKDFQHSDVGGLLNNFFFREADASFIVNLVKPGTDGDLLLDALPDRKNPVRFQQVDLYNMLVSNSQLETLKLILIGIAVIFLVLILYQRNVVKSITSVFPAVGATALTLGFLRTWNDTLNIMHVISLLLVLSMGVDYGIFISDNFKPGADRSKLSIAGLSVLISSLTTLLAFGGLIISGNVALNSIGYTVGFGIFASSALAFLFNIGLLTMRPGESS